MESIYEYTDYRVFLGDYYTWKKNGKEKFSHRIWAADAGFSASNFIKNVIDGKKDLGPSSVPKMISACKLKKKEGEYFGLLVKFAKSKNDLEKNQLFESISEIRSRKKVETLSEKQCRYYSKWYYPAVRELVAGKSIKTDFGDLGKLLVPEISYVAFANAVNDLLKMELIYIKNGKYYQSSNILKKGDSLVSLAVRNYQAEMMDLACKAMRELESTKRHISSVTLKLNYEKYHLLAGRIDEFRKEILQYAADDEDSDGVFQMNFQLFPLSKKIEI